MLNTDAEGRLILADALVRATEAKPDVVLDVATLTGHMVLALGDRVGGVMGTDEIVDAVIGAGETAGEAHWPMPLPEPITERVRPARSPTCSSTTGSGGAAASTPARSCASSPTACPWAHLDIAGPSFHSGSAYGHVTAGGTGFAVTTLVEYARTLADAKG